MHPTLLVMIDGVSADYLSSHPGHLPHLTALGREGLRVERLAADVPATSLPGRTSILTGVAADVHGIYGNVVWDGERFRYANPDDVRVPTLPRRAREAGRDVAVLGYGMVRPEDASVFHHAWWVGEMLQRARDLEPIPADEGWLRTARHVDTSGRLAALAATGLPAGVPDAYAGDRLHYLLAEVTGDATMLRWSAGLLTSSSPPDLVLSEILTPDSVQHAAGAGHPFSDWSVGYADGLIGTLVHELELAGVADDVNLVVTSDHGHGAIGRVLYPDALLPGRDLSVEGSFLYLRVEGEQDAVAADDVLSQHGVRRLDGTHLPPDARLALATFVAPGDTAFETGGPEGEVVGRPRNGSGHGFRPGHPADVRFLIARGPDVPRRHVAHAPSSAVEATLADLVGLSPFGEGASLVGRRGGGAHDG